MTLTNIEMEWTDSGARVLSTKCIPCPRCHFNVTPNEVHLCGDRVPKPPKKKQVTK